MDGALQDSGMKWCRVHLQPKKACVRDRTIHHHEQCEFTELLYMIESEIHVPTA